MADLKTELDVLAEENARLRIEREALEMVRAALQTIIDYENDCKAEGASLRLTYGEYDKAVDALAATAWNRRAQDVRGEAMEEAAKICEEEAAQYHARADELHAKGPITFGAEVDRWRCRANQAERSGRRIRAAAGEPPKEPNPT